jgi:hypothetical protein
MYAAGCVGVERTPDRLCDLTHDLTDSFELGDLPRSLLASEAGDVAMLGPVSASIGTTCIPQRAERNQSRDDRDDDRGECHFRPPSSGMHRACFPGTDVRVWRAWLSETGSTAHP